MRPPEHPSLPSHEVETIHLANGMALLDTSLCPPGGAACRLRATTAKCLLTNYTFLSEVTWPKEVLPSHVNCVGWMLRVLALCHQFRQKSTLSRNDLFCAWMIEAQTSPCPLARTKDGYVYLESTADCVSFMIETGRPSPTIGALVSPQLSQMLVFIIPEDIQTISGHLSIV